MSQQKFVLMNHTDMQGHHFGCARVMRHIEQALTDRGGVIWARIDGKMDWRKDPATLQKIADCDVIVINGEGTLHHGRKKASWLIAVGNHPVTQSKKLALINTLYQENPDSWAPMLRGFQYLYARDARSARAMSEKVGRYVTWLPDLSTAAGSDPSSVPRRGIAIGDSVSKTATNFLANLAMDLNTSEPTRILPLTISLREENPYRPALRRRLRRWTVDWRQRRQQRNFPILTYLRSEKDYVEAIKATRLSVTGRFHGICLNLVTATPFICITSNSWKIEALFEDAGIDLRRLVSIERLTKKMVMEEDWSFSKHEQENISSYLTRSSQQAKAMFDRIVGVEGPEL
jgi:hypothetical protein